MGRPLKFKTNEQLKEAIDEYFEYCNENKRPETIAGLAYHLGIERQSIYNYEKRDKFFDTVKKARDRILAGLEEALFMEGKSGQIFLAKNYGYSDKQEIEHSGGLRNTNIELTPEERKVEIDELIRKRARRN